MKARSGEGVVAVVIALFLLAGVALDSWGPKVSAEPPPVAEAGFAARAVFCPPALGRPASRVMLTAATRADRPVSLGFEPATDERTDLRPGTIIEHRPPTAGATDVVGYGGAVDATAVTSIGEPVSGVGAAACAPRASTRWYFAEGNSTVTHDERLLIYNPFPDEAVVRVTLLTRTGERSKAGLSDLAVPSEESIGVALEDFILEQKVLGAVVSAVRGRVVAWRLSIAEPEEMPSGIQFSLGTTATSDLWYFPEGAVGEGFEERLAIMNPGTEEAIVEISLVTSSRTIPAAGLTELTVAGATTAAYTLDPSMLPGETGGVGVTIRSTNGVGVVAERTVFYAAEDYDGVASEVGAPAPAERWYLGPATSRPATDSAVFINVAAEPVEVSLALVSADGGVSRPRTLQGLRIPPGSRLRVPLSAATDGEAMGVIATATGVVVAERFSYSAGAGDVASVMGIPLDEAATEATP